jgi:hypothetical protein
MRLSIIVILSCIMLSSCSSTKSVKISSKHLIDATVREKSKGSGSISLLDHQLTPIDYLHKNPDQKGLLVNHYMGTGKTYLGIGFAQSFPDRPVIILAPKFLESHWMNQLIEYGVYNPKRFMFVSYDDAPNKLGKLDVTNHILLADEVHNLIKHMRSPNADANARYIEVYTNLRKAYKIMGLTGTPIYGDESDIAYMINFVSGQDLMPFNQEAFRLEYTSVLPARQYFRGYLTESNFVGFISTFFLGNYLSAIFGLPGAFIGAGAGFLIPVATNWWLNLNTFKLRKLDVEKMRPVMNKYVSYFKFDESQFMDFPAQDFTVEEVPYNRQQYSFFLHLVEGDLPADQLQRLLKNESVQRDDNYILINSTNIHEQLYSAIGAGRDIGNFEFTDSQGKLIEPPKFVRILEQLNKHDEQTVLYSNYFETGILAFRDFLVRQGYQKRFAIIKPDLHMNEVNDIVTSYNKGDIQLLLLHPDITEGISLKGTQYLHILEPMLNSTVLEQVIGRSRRFQSHTHLPKDKQKVTVRMWQSTSSTWNPELSNINRANWYKRYRELNYMSRWGIGISQVDKKMDRKALNPEELALLKLKNIEKNFLEMQTLLTHESIESGYSRE